MEKVFVVVDGFNRRSDGGCAVDCKGPEKCAWHGKGTAVPEGEIIPVIRAETYQCVHFEGASVVKISGHIGRLDKKGFHLPTEEGQQIIATHPYFTEHLVAA